MPPSYPHDRLNNSPVSPEAHLAHLEIATPNEIIEKLRRDAILAASRLGQGAVSEIIAKPVVGEATPGSIEQKSPVVVLAEFGSKLQVARRAAQRNTDKAA